MDCFGQGCLGGFELGQIRPYIEASVEDGKITARTECPGSIPKTSRFT